ncbi:hypothetical protein MMPV_009689 [Pyropia vietnamensis]
MDDMSPPPGVFPSPPLPANPAVHPSAPGPIPVDPARSPDGYVPLPAGPVPHAAAPAFLPESPLSPVRPEPPPLTSSFRLPLGALPPAPVFSPTAAEWADPIAYIRHVRDSGGAAAGIAKIRPPSGWCPPYVIPDSLSFKTRLQAVHSLRHRTGSAEAFSAEVAECLASREEGGEAVEATKAAAATAAAATATGGGERGRRAAVKGGGAAANGGSGASSRRRRVASLATPSATSSGDHSDSSIRSSPATPPSRRGTRTPPPRGATPLSSSADALPFPPQVVVAGVPSALREVDLRRLHLAIDAAGGILGLVFNRHRWEPVIAYLRLAGMEAGGWGWRGATGEDATPNITDALIDFYGSQLSRIYWKYLSPYLESKRLKEVRDRAAAAAAAAAAATTTTAVAEEQEAQGHVVVPGNGLDMSGPSQAAASSAAAGKTVQSLTGAGAGTDTDGCAAAMSPSFVSPADVLSLPGGTDGDEHLPSGDASPALAVLPRSRSTPTIPLRPAKRARGASGSPPTAGDGDGSPAAPRGASFGSDVERTPDGTPGSSGVFRRAAARRAAVAVAAATATLNDDVDSILGAADCGRCGQGGDTDPLLMCCKCGISFHARCVAADGGEVPPTPPPPLPLPGAVPPPPRETPPRWTCASCDPRRGVNFGFRDGGRYTLKEFRDAAAAFKADMLGAGAYVPDPLAMYWAFVDGADQAVYVRYGSDLDTAVVGSGFPNPRAKAGRGGSGVSDPPPGACHETYEASGWNLNLFPMLRGSLLDYLPSSIRGVTVPWLYVGQLFSSFCYHAEDMNMLSINYMHVGEGKVWYGCPGGQGAHAFEAAMRASVPHLFKDEPGLLFSLVTMVPPTTLAAGGVPVCRTVQRPGEFVITFPHAYHGGFSLGYNIAEAVNFATPDWLRFAQSAVDRCRLYRRPPCFSVDRLIYRAAGAVGLAGRLSPLDAGYLADHLRAVGQAEVALRARLVELFGEAKPASTTVGGSTGVGDKDRSVARRAATTSVGDPHNQSGCGTCVECRQPAFLSAVRCGSRIGSSGSNAVSVWAAPGRRRAVIYCGPCAAKRPEVIRRAFPRPNDRRLVVSLTNEQLWEAVEAVEAVARGEEGGGDWWRPALESQVGREVGRPAEETLVVRGARRATGGARRVHPQGVGRKGVSRIPESACRPRVCHVIATRRRRRRRRRRPRYSCQRMGLPFVLLFCSHGATITASRPVFHPASEGATRARARCPHAGNLTREGGTAPPLGRRGGEGKGSVAGEWRLTPCGS